MDEAGLWKLFFATGLPEAYLALQGQRMEQKCVRQTALTAFHPLKRDKTQI